MFYGVRTAGDLFSDTMAPVLHEASPINHVTADEPPAMLIYDAAMTPTPLPEMTRPEVLAHHPKFGELLKERMDAAGVPCFFYHRKSLRPKNAEKDFLRRYLLQS